MSSVEVLAFWGRGLLSEEDTLFWVFVSPSFVPSFPTPSSTFSFSPIVGSTSFVFFSSSWDAFLTELSAIVSAFLPSFSGVDGESLVGVLKASAGFATLESSWFVPPEEIEDFVSCFLGSASFFTGVLLIRIR